MSSTEPDASEPLSPQLAELAARERREERIERSAMVLGLLAFALASHSLGAPDAIVYNLTGGALTLLLPQRARVASRVPVGLLVGTAAAGLSIHFGAMS